MTKTEYLSLYEKYLKGNCTAEEMEALQNCADDFSLAEPEEVSPEKAELLYSKLKLAIQDKEQTKTRPLYWKLSIAASLVLVLFAGLMYSLHYRKQTPALSLAKGVKPIVPGSNKAVLTLGDGRTIILNNAGNGEIATENGTRVRKDGDGLLSYQVGETRSEELVFNTVSIPRGGQYSLILPDGSKVWLNAETKLKFPNRFVGDKREVELDGEGYFEIAKNKQKPFFVKANGVSVKVLGTHFNVMAYKDEPLVRTTLVEGRVILSAAGQSVYLIPGQQGLFSKDGLMVSNADVDGDLAWKNGYFVFNDDSLATIMHKISRWYNVDIDMRTNNKLSYTGSVSKFKNIDEVLKVLSLTGTVKFKIEERRVIVNN
ncbi:FecR family protein [Pedobacter jamesrossensis]|uniref:FecR family protein n=1 Tax=Pedobacter jamesrossensis TaxID=1908238 RepID=A0ABV8NK21_9SPHI